MKKVFKIGGMHCTSCAMLIEEELKDKVNSIKVDHASGKAEIDFNEKKISGRQIKDIIAKMGYKVQ